MRTELAVLVPTRGRPGNIRKVISAWDFTNAWDVAHLIVIRDADDPEFDGYEELFEQTRNPDTGEALFSIVTMDHWMPMVHKLNLVAQNVALTRKYFALGFAGDDHLPQTIGWARRYVEKLHELSSGMVYSDDGYQGQNLSTEWAVTSDAVRALGRMVPAPVEHMYCDNSMMDVFGGAGALAFLPEVRIEHMHPIAGKAESDDQYKRVNHRDQFKTDKREYDIWRRSAMLADIATIRSLRPDLPDIRPVKVVDSRLTPGSMPRHVPPRPRGQKAVTRYGIPRHFKRVVGATPDEIGVTLADFASQVPADQEIVELGVYQARTALLMAWGARQGNGAHVTGIDAWDLEGNTYGPPFNQKATKTWADYNVMNLGYNSSITLVQGFSTEQAADWGGKPIGLLFVDDDHSYEGARSAIELWSPHLAPGALIAVDDYGHPDWPGVAQAVDALVAEGVLEPIEIFHDRLAVTRLAVNPDTEESRGMNEHNVAPTAITSEGVHPVPVLAELPVERESATGQPVNTESAPPEGWVQDEEGRWLDPSEMNLGQLRALAKKRNIVLGKRKDLKADIVQALRDGK